MKNTYELVWSDKAKRDLKKIIEYLEENWSEREINKFAKLLDRRLQLIASSPLLFPDSENSNGIRRPVLSKQTSIYFKIVEDKIRIMNLFDNRQNPDKLKKL